MSTDMSITVRELGSKIVVSLSAAIRSFAAS
jgi:hypothetical protein